MARTKKLENVASGGWPKINQGSHLTVKTFEDGRTELVWDDEALLGDVRAAILKAESRIPVVTNSKSSDNVPVLDNKKPKVSKIKTARQK